MTKRFAKSCAMGALYQRDLRVNVLVFQRGLHANVPAWQRAESMQTFYFFVPTCHTACQCFNLVCEQAKRRVNFVTWRANVPKGVTIFKHPSFEMLREIFILYCHIILYFYTPSLLKEKCEEFFFFIVFFFFLILN